MTKNQFLRSGHAVRVPALLDPQPVNGVRVAGKGTPGIHCDQRAGCAHCLALTSCLWNHGEKKCVPTATVGAMSRKDQWNHVASCDRNAPPTQQRTDRRDRGSMRQAVANRRMDQRASVVVAPTALVEFAAPIDAHNPSMRVPGGMQLFLDEQPGSAVEAKEVDETSNIPIAEQFRFAKAKAQAEVEASTETEAHTETETETEAEAGADAESETEADATTEVDASADADAETETESATETEADATAESESESDSTVESRNTELMAEAGAAAQLDVLGAY